MAIGHLSVGFSGGEGIVFEQRGGLLAMTGLDITKSQRGNGDTQRRVVAYDAFQNANGLIDIAEAHLLITVRGAQKRMARLESQTLFKFIAGKLNLVLIVVYAGAMVVEDGGADGVGRSTPPRSRI
jgi:hypothetical protein